MDWSQNYYLLEASTPETIDGEWRGPQDSHTSLGGYYFIDVEQALTLLTIMVTPVIQGPEKL